MNSVEKIKQGENNPEKKIYFFAHTKKPMGYVLMSHRITIDMFYDYFPNSEEVTEAEFDQLVNANPDYEVVFVGDEHIIDKHFTEEGQID